MLFNENGKLTEEAIHVARFTGVEPHMLYPRPIESFMKKGISQKEAER